jgi:uncharacterized protein (TIGR00304 family)
MNKYHGLAVLLLIVAIVILGYSVSIGEAQVGFFLIFPFFSGQGIYSFLGIILFVIAILVGFYGFIQGGEWVLAGEDDYEELFGTKKRSRPVQKPHSRPGQTQTPEPRPRPKVRGGGVVLIGPIPIIFGSDKKSAIILSILAIIIMVIAMIAIFGGFFMVR